MSDFGSYVLKVSRGLGVTQFSGIVGTHLLFVLARSRQVGTAFQHVRLPEQSGGQAGVNFVDHSFSCQNNRFVTFVDFVD